MDDQNEPIELFYLFSKLNVHKGRIAKNKATYMLALFSVNQKTTNFLPEYKVILLI